MLVSLFIDPLRILKGRFYNGGAVNGAVSLFIDPLRILKLK